MLRHSYGVIKTRTQIPPLPLAESLTSAVTETSGGAVTWKMKMHALAKCWYLAFSRLHVLILWQWSSAWMCIRITWRACGATWLGPDSRVSEWVWGEEDITNLRKFPGDTDAAGLEPCFEDHCSRQQYTTQILHTLSEKHFQNMCSLETELYKSLIPQIHPKAQTLQHRIIHQDSEETGFPL